MSAPLPSHPEDTWIGRVIDGRYRILRRLGEGGMGVVFEAEHLKLGKRVALKAIAPERIGDAEIAARFTREAMATAQIEHPHIAAGFDYGLLPEGGAYLVAQLVRGTSLRERLGRGPTPWREACAIAAQIADALTAIHRAGYVHRDLTPENVLVADRDDGTSHVYVLDLGVAALLAASAPPPQPTPGTLTVMGTIVGTAGYMAPEQALGRVVDARADLYVVGVLLWEMIAGRPLFARDGGLTAIVASQLSSEPPGAPAPFDTTVPFDLERLLRDLLSVEPDRRPATASDVRTELLRIHGSLAREPTARVELPAPPPDPLEDLARTASALGDRIRAAMRTRDGARGLAIGLGVGAVPAMAMMIGAYALLAGDAPAASTTPAAHAPAAVVAPAVAIPAAPEPPGPHDATIERMLHSRQHRERERSAQALLDADPATVPAYARLVASLTIANRCPQRAQHLEAIRTLGDPRALPAVERLAAESTTGCGRRGRFDCYACLREQIPLTIAALTAARDHD
ncbi:serine/threonine-protein kinase [Sandaracinus amylolyticus]|uniref:Serine/threonine protein kinase n=1 Tax=Sandaracinus amylolyticus TaxID=927083 RepID=A0A0F6SH75_9BACT|nr:serine/threonine-protein kinase [Sandaracinus amylolyticus]AKF09954.1 Serine/threonine protein kinase [Sandaracinus amylolyticus]